MSVHGALMSRAKPIALRLSVLAVLLSAPAVAIQSKAQVRKAIDFTRRAESLQHALNLWQGVLKSMSFGHAPVSNPSLSDLRDQCLERISTLRAAIARVSRDPTLGQQFSLLSSLTSFDYALHNLRNALLFALAADESAAEGGTLAQDEEKIEGAPEEPHEFYNALRSELFRELRAGTEGRQAKVVTLPHKPGEI